jgi:hypothetical protein
MPRHTDTTGWAITHATNALYWNASEYGWVNDLGAATLGSHDYITSLLATLPDPSRGLVTNTRG